MLTSSFCWILRHDETPNCWCYLLSWLIGGLWIQHFCLDLELSKFTSSPYMLHTTSCTCVVETLKVQFWMFASPSCIQFSVFSKNSQITFFSPTAASKAEFDSYLEMYHPLAFQLWLAKFLPYLFDFAALAFVRFTRTCSLYTRIFNLFLSGDFCNFYENILVQMRWEDSKS